MFALERGVALTPEVTNYVRMLGEERLGSAKLFYVARCFRDESACDAERLREFTQVGVELLGKTPLDCRKTVRRDALALFERLLPGGGWTLRDGVKRGLNLYDDSKKNVRDRLDHNTQAASGRRNVWRGRGLGAWPREVDARPLDLGADPSRTEVLLVTRSAVAAENGVRSPAVLLRTTDEKHGGPMISLSA